MVESLTVWAKILHGDLDAATQRSLLRHPAVWVSALSVDDVAVLGSKRGEGFVDFREVRAQTLVIFYGVQRR